MDDVWLEHAMGGERDLDAKALGDALDHGASWEPASVDVDDVGMEGAYEGFDLSDEREAEGRDGVDVYAREVDHGVGGVRQKVNLGEVCKFAGEGFDELGCSARFAVDGGDVEEDEHGGGATFVVRL